MLLIRLWVNNMLSIIKFWRSQKYIWILSCVGRSALPTPILFKGQIYIQSGFLDYVLKLTYFIISSPHLSLSKELVMLFRLPETVGLYKEKNILNLIPAMQITLS